MSGSVVYQQALFLELVAHFPSTRYQGSKAKLADWIYEDEKLCVFAVSCKNSSRSRKARSA